MTHIKINANAGLVVMLLICLVCLVIFKGDTSNYITHNVYQYNDTKDLYNDIDALYKNCGSAFITTAYKIDGWAVFVQNESVCNSHDIDNKYCHIPIEECLDYSYYKTRPQIN